MQVDRAAVDIRPRNIWQAIDLGFSAAQRWWPLFIAPWLIAASISFALGIALFPDQLWLSSLLFWWLKPLYDRLLLFVFSRAMFGDAPSTGTTLRALPKIIFDSGLLLNLTLFRLNPARSFSLPVWQLEGLRRRERPARLRLLKKQTYFRASLLTTVCIHLESVLVLGLFATLLLFIPDTLPLNLAALENQAESSFWFNLSINVAYALAVLIIEPIYVASGFMLYINRRIHLEGWDMELDFRRMAKRLQALAPLQVIVAACLILMLQFSPDSAAHANEALRPGEVAREVLSGSEFSQTQTAHIWIPKPKKPFPSSADGAPLIDIDYLILIAKSIRLVLIVIAVVLLGIVILYRKRWLKIFGNTETEREPEHLPEHVAGLEVRPKTLPVDIPATALMALEQSNYRDGLSLLYRGALNRLLERSLPLQESHTEDDVLRLAAHELSPVEQDYLRELTQSWQLVAWGHRVPVKESAMALADRWRTVFGSKP